MRADIQVSFFKWRSIKFILLYENSIKMLEYQIDNQQKLEKI